MKRAAVCPTKAKSPNNNNDDDKNRGQTHSHPPKQTPNDDLTMLQ